MTIEELAQNLIKITSRLPEAEAEQVRLFISASRTKTLGLVTEPINKNAQGNLETDKASTAQEGLIGGQ
ncbi:MAG: hypothetical protein WCT03_26105, partial [Candidatus Obscuribacterales bacterium]